jgi:hypothetical protein
MSFIAWHTNLVRNGNFGVQNQIDFYIYSYWTKLNLKKIIEKIRTTVRYEINFSKKIELV